MAKDMLLEIGLEEVPARFLPDAIEQLKEAAIRFFKAHRIVTGEIRTFTTPRRLALLVSDVKERQEDLVEEIKGPAKRIAVDEKEEWTRAALGFVRSKGGRVEDLYFREVKGEEVLFLHKEEKGIPSKEILPQFATVITSLSFPKNMKWGSEELRFVRPIRWILFLFGEDEIVIELAGVKSGRFSFGHRFLGDKVRIDHPAEYEEKLFSAYCVVDPDKRRKMIVDGIRRLEEEQGWKVPLDQDLLLEVTHLVEYPTPFFGAFEPEYLQIPKDVLITTMKEHQRYFHVEDPAGKLLPFFVAVRNGAEERLDLVRKGNEKVLRARLADARFFYEEDGKLEIETAMEKLEHVVYHEELGTVADKVRRIRELAGEWAEELKLDEKSVERIDRAASISKFDLVTQMVYEFPELQGRMGEIYALNKGEDREVAKAIFQHYLPRFSGDMLPTSDVGAVIALADKMDTIAGSFAIGIIPSGSQDPYGLRRAAQGVVQILVDRGYPFTLGAMFDRSIHVYRRLIHKPFDEERVKKALWEFFLLRLRNLLQDEGVRYDVIEAVLAVKIGKIDRLLKKAKLLEKKTAEPSFKTVVDSIIRVHHLAEKASGDRIEPNLFQEESERRLWEDYTRLEERVTEKEKEEADEAILEAFAGIKGSIDQFFADVLVMAEDDRVRDNRLSLLLRLSSLFDRFADFEKLVIA